MSADDWTPKGVAPIPRLLVLWSSPDRAPESKALEPNLDQVFFQRRLRKTLFDWCWSLVNTVAPDLLRTCRYRVAVALTACMMPWWRDRVAAHLRHVATLLEVTP